MATIIRGLCRETTANRIVRISESFVHYGSITDIRDASGPGCAAKRDEHSGLIARPASVIFYTRERLYNIRRRALGWNDNNLALIAACADAGVLYRRGCRAGRKKQRPITVVLSSTRPSFVRAAAQWHHNKPPISCLVRNRVLTPILPEPAAPPPPRYTLVLRWIFRRRSFSVRAQPNQSCETSCDRATFSRPLSQSN